MKEKILITGLLPAFVSDLSYTVQAHLLRFDTALRGLGPPPLTKHINMTHRCAHSLIKIEWCGQKKSWVGKRNGGNNVNTAPINEIYILKRIIKEISEFSLKIHSLLILGSNKSKIRYSVTYS